MGMPWIDQFNYSQSRQTLPPVTIQFVLRLNAHAQVRLAGIGSVRSSKLMQLAVFLIIRGNTEKSSFASNAVSSINEAISGGLFVFQIYAPERKAPDSVRH